MKNQVQLITYVDRLCGDLKRLRALMQGPLRGLFGGLHLLPFYHPIDGADAGFDPTDHTQVDPRLGDWNDVRALSEEVDVMADLIVNHTSAASPQFKDFSRNGTNSPFAGMFLTYERVFPVGAREEELLRIYRPRPGLPFTNALLDSGERCLLWTTFTPQQIDIDVEHPQGEAYLDAIFRRFQAAGIGMIRLDAVGYAIKKRATSCFMIPETFRFIASLAAKARALGMEVLVEIHSHYSQQLEMMMKNPYALGFSAAIFLYVAVESAIYVWMPTLLAGYRGRAAWMAAYAISIFFVLRAAGRFIGSWMLARLNWAAVVTIFSLAIFICFIMSAIGGIGIAVFLLPMSGLFMSVLYPTINSKGISCFRKPEHGAVAGVILFFTCLSAVLGPLAMGAVSDSFGDPKYGFILATGFACVLFIALLLNWILNPARSLLQKLDVTEYQVVRPQDVPLQP